MPAMHMLRLVLMMLANPKTFSRGLFMLRRSLGKAAGGAASGVGAAPPPDSRTWRKSFEVVFVDSTGWLNLAASMSKAALVQARSAAAHSIQMLNLGTPEAFDAVFATRQRLVSGVGAGGSGGGWEWGRVGVGAAQRYGTGMQQLLMHAVGQGASHAQRARCAGSCGLAGQASALPATCSCSSWAQRHAAAAQAVGVLYLVAPQPASQRTPMNVCPGAAQAATCDYWFHVRMPPAVPRVNTAGRLLPLRGHSAENKDLLQDVPAWR